MTYITAHLPTLEELKKQLEEVNDTKHYPVFSTNDRESVLITKSHPKKRKKKTVEDWENEIDLGGTE